MIEENRRNLANGKKEILKVKEEREMKQQIEKDLYEELYRSDINKRSPQRISSKSKTKAQKIAGHNNGRG